MRNYRIELESSGVLTQLPDSQKLFGALMYMFSEIYGSQKATALTQGLLDKRTHLALSNVLPSGYLPVPQDCLMDCVVNAADTEVQWKQKRAAIKERSYLKPEELEQILKTPLKCEDIFPYIKLANHQQLRASIESVRHDIPELDSKLYSVPKIALREIESASEEKPLNNFCFYLQVADDAIGNAVVDMLRVAVEQRDLIILGKRASQGLNTFELTAIGEPDLPNISTDKFLNTGMLLPDGINFADSTVKLFTSERRPFEMVDGWDKNFAKQYISFIAEGSIIFVNASGGAGKSIPSPFNRPRDIVFGNAFLYPISRGEGGL
jgi:CRISPR type III-A-associated RAMP protein Csm4